MLDWLQIFEWSGNDRGEWVGEVWLNVALWVWVLAALGIVTYLVAARAPDGDAVMGVILMAMMAGFVWPLCLLVGAGWWLRQGVQTVLHPPTGSERIPTVDLRAGRAESAHADRPRYRQTTR